MNSKSEIKQEGGNKRTIQAIDGVVDLTTPPRTSRPRVAVSTPKKTLGTRMTK